MSTFGSILKFVSFQEAHDDSMAAGKSILVFPQSVVDPNTGEKTSQKEGSLGYCEISGLETDSKIVKALKEEGADISDYLNNQSSFHIDFFNMSMERNYAYALQFQAYLKDWGARGTVVKMVPVLK